MAGRAAEVCAAVPPRDLFPFAVGIHPGVSWRDIVDGAFNECAASEVEAPEPLFQVSASNEVFIHCTRSFLSMGG